MVFDIRKTWMILLWIAVNFAWALFWLKNNWFMVRTLVDYVLGKSTGETFYNGKVMKDDKSKNK